ncbi:MAG: c-type cytochrome [bacterium]|nr:c-type cytochrome [bacterium]
MPLTVAELGVLAASTQRAVGVILAVVAIGGFVLYWIFNWFVGRAETGSEIELAPNRKPLPDDAEMEGRRLDQGLMVGLVCTVVIAIGLPLYWMGEPGRHDGLIEVSDELAAERGHHLYEERCATCHGSVDGPGGLRDHTLVDNNGIFLAQVQWKVPSLAAVLYRYSTDEVRYVMEYGRPNTPMPPWGIAGGGPFTTQQIDDVIVYMEHNQIDVAENRQRTQDGIASAARGMASEELGAGASTADIAAAAQQMLADAAEDPVRMGELLFNNAADGGVYGCARCHTPGWSYDADEIAAQNPLVPFEIAGGGGFGPPLANGATTRQFDTASEHEDFIAAGSQNGIKYGNFGQGDGGGQMPSFGVCVADRDAGDLEYITRAEFCAAHGGEGILTPEQIAAIVAYERQL